MRLLLLLASSLLISSCIAPTTYNNSSIAYSPLNNNLTNTKCYNKIAIITEARRYLYHRDIEDAFIKIMRSKHPERYIVTRTDPDLDKLIESNHKNSWKK